MKVSNLFLSLVLPLTVLACGKTHDSGGQAASKSSPQSPAQSQDLSGMALPDLLSAKYESVALNCNMWTRMHGPLFITDTPDDTVSIDLLKDSSFPKTIHLAAKSEIHTLNIQIKFTDLKLQSGGYRDGYGTQIRFKNSPVVYGQYSGQSSTAYQAGYVGEQLQDNSLNINENIVSQVVAGSAGPQSEPSPTVDYVECSVTTKAKAEYKNEWILDTPGNEPSCLLGLPLNLNDCMLRRN